MVNCRMILVGLCLIFVASKTLASQDPTAPLNWIAPKTAVSKKVKKTYPVPTLQSIVCREESNCYAVLDDKLANVDDLISGYKVRKITQKEVTIVRGNVVHHLALFKLDIKN
ncbi:MSHA biogenesis protein MshK [Vibrio sp. F74]|uniref:MSHA biogenesis protein MshK n=1 Tax=Vibrio sp. F74 TaxID=700020 RepID=UPI0035F5F66A